MVASAPHARRCRHHCDARPYDCRPVVVVVVVVTPRRRHGPARRPPIGRRRGAVFVRRGGARASWPAQAPGSRPATPGHRAPRRIRAGRTSVAAPVAPSSVCPSVVQRTVAPCDSQTARKRRNSCEEILRRSGKILDAYRTGGSLSREPKQVDPRAGDCVKSPEKTSTTQNAPGQPSSDKISGCLADS